MALLELLNFKKWSSGELSKIGHHFRKYSDLKIDVIRNVNNKKCAPKLVLFNEKKMRKITMIFDVRD